MSPEGIHCCETKKMGKTMNICASCGWVYPHSELFDGKCDRCLDIEERQAAERKSKGPADCLLERVVARCRMLEVDHAPDGWPAIQMSDITVLCDAAEALIKMRIEERQAEKSTGGSKGNII